MFMLNILLNELCFPNFYKNKFDADVKVGLDNEYIKFVISSSRAA
jgi:hypothetical protein